MNLPTFLTFLRILLTFGMIYLLYMPGVFAKSMALSIFILAGATDWLDGYLARKWNQISDLGALMDPIADKLMVLGCFGVFCHQGWVPLWMVLIILIREIGVTAYRLVAVRRNVVIPAEKEGKLKMVLQFWAIFCIFLLSIVVESTRLSSSLQTPLTWLVDVSLWAAVLLTLYSGILFFWRIRRS